LPLFLAIKKALDQHLIGNVKMIRLNLFQPHESAMIARTEINWRVIPEISGGGLFYDLAPHQLDIILFLFGDAVRYGGYSVHQTDFYEAEDTVSGIIELPGNIIFNGNWCFTMPEFLKEDSCEIIGERGVIQFAVFDNYYVLRNENGKETFRFQHPEHIQQPMIQKVVNYFRGNEPNPCSAEEALKSLSIMEAFVHNQ
jgi:predicted dehydrogenase